MTKTKTEAEIKAAKREANKKWYANKKAKEAEERAKSNVKERATVSTQDQGGAPNTSGPNLELQAEQYKRIIDNLTTRLNNTEAKYNALRVAVLRHNTYIGDVLRQAHVTTNMAKELLEASPLMKDTGGLA